MDDKEKSQVTRLHARITAGAFSEDDVYFLFLLLRAHAPQRSPLREIGDFVAHRERDRGLVFDYIQKTKATLEASGDRMLTIQPIFDVASLSANLSEALSTFGLDPFPPGRDNDIQTCVVSLLQRVKLVNKSGADIGRLEVSVSPASIELSGVLSMASGQEIWFPVLCADNTSYPCKERQSAVCGLTWAECRCGKLTLSVT